MFALQNVFFCTQRLSAKTHLAGPGSNRLTFDINVENIVNRDMHPLATASLASQSQHGMVS